MPLTPAERTVLIDRYAAGPARLRAALAVVPPELMARRPAADDWSPHEIAIHCADSETNAALRIRYLVGEREPVIMGYDESGWAARLDYQSHPLEPALAVVDAVRANTVALVRRLPEETWSRTGTHTESGPYSAEDWLRIYAAHLEDHAAQIAEGVARMR